MTNADKIRAMTEEELAMLLKPTCPPIKCPKKPYDVAPDSYKCWLDWLKQEVADNGGHSDPEKGFRRGGHEMSERKYTKGALIMSVGQFAALGGQWFILGDRPKHRSFLESMQYRTLANLIRAGRIYEAHPSGTTAKMKEAGYIGNTARAVFTEEIET